MSRDNSALMSRRARSGRSGREGASTPPVVASAAPGSSSVPLSMLSRPNSALMSTANKERRNGREKLVTPAAACSSSGPSLKLVKPASQVLKQWLPAEGCPR